MADRRIDPERPGLTASRASPRLSPSWNVAGDERRAEQPVREGARVITGQHGERAAWLSPVESGLQRRPDLRVDDEIREIVEIGLFAIDDDEAGARLLRRSWQPAAG